MNVSFVTFGSILLRFGVILGPKLVLFRVQFIWDFFCDFGKITTEFLSVSAIFGQFWPTLTEIFSNLGQFCPSFRCLRAYKICPQACNFMPFCYKCLFWKRPKSLFFWGEIETFNVILRSILICLSVSFG